MVGVNGLEPLRREAMDFEYGQWPGNNPWNAGGQPFLRKLRPYLSMSIL